LASISKRGNVWLVSYRDPTKPGQKAPQRMKTCRTEKAAKLLKIEIEKLKLEGRAACNGRLPLMILLRESLEVDRHRLKPSTYNLYDQIIEKRIAPAIGNIAIEKITPRFLTSYYAGLMEKDRFDGKQGGLSGSRVNVVQTLISRALKKAVQWNYLSTDPSAVVKRQSYQAGEMAFLLPDELATLIEAARKPSKRCLEQQGLSTNPVFADLVLLLAETGCRKSEALALQWKSVDIAKGRITFERSVMEIRAKMHYGLPKNRERRGISIASQVELIASLRKLRARQAEAKLKLGEGYINDDLVFCWPNGEAIRGETFGHAFSALVKRSSIPRIRLHDLRHTHASILINNGATGLQVAKRLGHKNPSLTLNVYSHLFPEQGEATSEIFARSMTRGEKKAKGNDVVRSVVLAVAG
jgi:integrase